MTEIDRSSYVEWVNNRLHELSKHAPMWGSQEGVEFQYLQLLEFRDVLRNPQRLKDPDIGSRYVIDRYISFLQVNVKGRVPNYLHQTGKSWEEIMSLLRQFNMSLCEKDGPEHELEKLFNEEQKRK